jgi:hypothetical protein
MSTIPPNDFALIESIVNQVAPKAQEDFRTLLQGFSAQIAQVSAAQGVTQGQTAKNAAAPPQAALAASGANGAFNLTVQPAPETGPGAVWHEISSSPVKGFTSGVNVEALTTATNLVVNKPGQTLFFRVRSSYNKTVFNQPTLHGQQAVASGLLSSAATESAAAFNQTNLGVVNTSAQGTTVVATVSGAGGTLSSVPTVKGATEGVAPAATLIGVRPGATHFVGYDNARGTYLLGAILPDVMGDGITPIGKFSAVGTGIPKLPTIVPVISAGYIIGYDVTDGGAGASQPYTLTFGSVGGGAGAVPGAQTIVGGVLTGIAPGNPGNGAYAGGTTLTASGGSGGGTPGGGTADGTTNGRLTT